MRHPIQYLLPSRLADRLGRPIRTSPLASCLAATFAVHLAVAADAPVALDAWQADLARGATNSGPSAPHQVRTVLNCDDSGQGSLRDVITNVAQPGDTVDMSALQCGVITLMNGEIVVPQNDLTLVGAGPTATFVSGNHASRIFDHEGTGTLALRELTVKYGYHHTSLGAYGGCINSAAGNVYLFDSAVRQCKSISDQTLSRGGAIRAETVTLVGSEVSGSEAASQMTWGWGGGVSARYGLIAKYSSISSNTAGGPAASAGAGGGAFVGGTTTLRHSTIDHNVAGSGGGLMKQGNGAVTISESTVSSNSTYGRGSALYITMAGSASKIENSTIAFNHAYQFAEGAIYAFQGGTLTLQSSIVADNTAGIVNQPYDLAIDPTTTLAGADNLVIASNVSPPNVITVTADPKLTTLQFRGGLTKTHGLAADSPAIGMGNDTAGSANDQRGAGYPRTSGPAALVDIGALQSDFIFVDGFEP